MEEEAAEQQLVRRQKTRLDYKHLFQDQSGAATNIYERSVTNGNSSRCNAPHGVQSGDGELKKTEIKRLVALKPQIHLLNRRDS